MVDVIRSLGGGSGIDTTALVTGLVAAERQATDTRLDSKQEKLEAQISAYGTLKSSLSTFKGLLSTLADNDTFNSRSVAFPDTNVITPNSIDPGAQPGSYQIEVEEVAQAHSITFDPVADKNAAMNISGNLTIQFGAWTYDGLGDPQSLELNADKAALTIEVSTSDTLQTLANKINLADGGVRASILTIDGQAQLQLNAQSGANNALKVSADDVSLVGFEFNATNFSQANQTQKGVDALIYVNGLQVTRDSNEIDDVIPGFNFSINKKAPDEQFTFVVEEDTSVAKQAVRDFVAGYNELYTTIDNLVGFTTNEETNTQVPGGLYNDGSARALFNQLRSLISQTVPGVDSGFNALTNIGIRTELDGTLSIDESDFDRGFNEQFALLEALFSPKLDSANPFVTGQQGTYATRATPGSYAIEVSTDPSKGSVAGNALNFAQFVAADDTLSSAFNAALGDYSFKIEVNGVESNTITLSDSYDDVESIRLELMSLINGDENLSAAGTAIDISYDPDTNAFTFSSREYGSSSTVKFTEIGLDIGELGIDLALTSTDGVDVVGLIDGSEAFGSGNVLLPALDSSLYGLSFTVSAGATMAGASGFNFSRGFAGEMQLLIERFLSKDGVIANRETSISDQLDNITEDRKELDRRMDIYEARISAQFLAMEQIISALNSTSSSLDGLIDRLPFTASKK
ncbi:MAG: flagellar filament capping protein FliD [Oceanospirillaceae bacterium]|nr:flagellar filament capping protein FliD [Oceanospirillaceae bacterium]